MQYPTYDGTVVERTPLSGPRDGRISDEAGAGAGDGSTGEHAPGTLSDD